MPNELCVGLPPSAATPQGPNCVATRKTCGMHVTYHDTRHYIFPPCALPCPQSSVQNIYLFSVWSDVYSIATMNTCHMHHAYCVFALVHG
mmetsp:Transcript_108543/g.187631  ORF Transcript_108543/g.187631 Transcript_108543/m.187631 type:complete len:90 (-) Transcript_108543:689-958(-)